MLTLSILPFWEKFRQFKFVQDALVGITAASTGLIAGSFVFMYVKAVHNLGEAAVLVACGALVSLFGVQVPIAIFVSGLIGWMMLKLDMGGNQVS